MGIGTSYDQWKKTSHDTLPPVILACGPETSLKDEFLESLQETHPDPDREVVTVYADESDPSEFLQEIRGRGLFRSTKWVVLKNLHHRQGGRAELVRYQEVLEEYVQDPEPGVLLVLEDRDHPYQKGRKIGQLARVVENVGWTIVFWEPFDRSVRQELEKRFEEAGLRVQEPAVRSLLERTRGKYSRAMQEAEKLVQVVEEELTRETVESVVNREESGDAYDSLSEALSRGRVGEAVEALEELWRQQESEVRVFRSVTNFFHRVRKLNHDRRQGHSLESGLKDLGLPTSRTVKDRYKRALDRYGNRFPGNFYRRAYEAARGAKYGDRSTRRFSVESFLLWLIPRLTRR